MKFSFTSLVSMLCLTGVMAGSLNRYQVSPPAEVAVLQDRQALNEFVKSNPDGFLHSENGGYYMKDLHEAVVAIASDDLCGELDGSWANAESSVEDDEDDDVTDVTKRELNSLNASNKCSHPRCFNHATCLTYSNCHVCGSRKKCI
ncbi:unnamed protein product [Penicillium salamii]|uniref:Uncharacterized protein n=1 Tax=Penicillium salamii TaxID=1612424 RepID=A0A9W4J0Y5_9EURO|nr:unnamed protein product [Penicillium salamii]CAG8175870.1 unnamed protein product [Penicillium salamii]CAG8265298.1 unnamed protein product [Penicillium salamii]CAG8363071.1 unnamed protein product [Penicillium salamii]CAG8365660.1 unnamed protein product [Penicillium salamii]